VIFGKFRIEQIPNVQKPLFLTLFFLTLTPKPSKTGFFDPFIFKLISELFSQNFCELKKTDISEKFPNFGN
jgi:hypothetical protein